MNISTLLRLVVPAAEREENETAAKPEAGHPARASSSAVPGARTAPSPIVPAKVPGTPAARSAPERPSSPALAPPEPKTDGTYQFGAHGQPVTEKLSTSLQAKREFPSIKALEARYPHVLVRIRAAWGNPREFDLLMRDLLLPSRQGRAGFDPDAALELTRLQDYYALVVAPLTSSR